MKPSARIVFWRRVGRALVGAVWSAPLRFITIPAIVGAMMLANGGPLAASDFIQWNVLLSGIGTSLALRFLDNMIVEFALFPALTRAIRGEKK